MATRIRVRKRRAYKYKRPVVYMPALSRTWRVINESRYPDDQVCEILKFVFDQTGGLSAAGAIRLADSKRDGHYSGYACDALRGHGMPSWAEGRRMRYAVRLTLSPPDWYLYGHPKVCWHSTEAKRIAIGASASPDGYDHDRVYEHLAGLWDKGVETLGRWPIYILWNWREMLVHLAAHEIAHLIEFDRDRQRSSEVLCETFALRCLEEWRRQRHPSQRAASALIADRGLR